MQLTTLQREGLLEFQVAGRLDAYWADHFTTSVLAAVRQGSHRIEVDLSAVEYISSAGLGAMTRCYKEIRFLNGTFRISRASDIVLKVLAATGLSALLTRAEFGGPGTTPDPAIQPAIIRLENARIEVHACSPGATALCRLRGSEPFRFHAGESAGRCEALGESVFSIGVGAAGRDWADCRARLGEYLSAAGCVTYLPTDGGNVPDYLLSSERFVPELHTLSSLTWQSRFSHLMRFETTAGTPLSLEALAEQVLAVAQAKAAGLVMVAEIDGLVGAALCRSPALAGADAKPTAFPHVRDWLTFTAERSYSRLSGLVVGVVTATDIDLGLGGLAPWVRPLGAANGPRGHCHAAAFPYRPLPKGAIDLNGTVRGLFDSESTQGLLHLLNDDRPAIGNGQSSFTSGACWVVPISAIEVEKP